eukprot:3377297-Prymnesium_polylepis.1
MQALKASSEEEADVEEVEEEDSTFIKIPLKLTSEQAATSKYVFVSGPDDENNYLYKKASDTSASAKMVAPVAKAVSKVAYKGKSVPPPRRRAPSRRCRPRPLRRRARSARSPSRRPSRSRSRRTTRSFSRPRSSSA